MTFIVTCPEWKTDKKPDKDDQPLFDVSRRVYQGQIIGDDDGCKKLKKGEEGWALAHVVWSSDNKAELYAEDTAIYVGEDTDDGPGIALFLDGNGDPKQFNAMYIDPVTNVLNEPGLSITVEVKNPDYFKLHPEEKPDKDDFDEFFLVNKQKLKPTPWALWALHSVDAQDLLKELRAFEAKEASDISDLKKYIDNQISDLHSQIQSEMAALQKQIDSKVSSVGAIPPIASTGGTNPVISLIPCADGQVYVYSTTAGRWQCQAQSTVMRGPAVQNRNVPHCGNTDLLTIQTSCSYALANCIDPATTGTACDPAPAQCTFQQTDTQQVCVHTHQQCEFWGCFPVCDQTVDYACGNCNCTFPTLGNLIAK